ncbi:ABC transporter substrate-binding protein [Acuticoccus kandeliae]|uniref:ABC transporter substrate-binding protein n=1 Tax=Acuticoccus kandeliae TaxID=2073160 RepID=UPI000D3E0A76|nr:ABC transporter substrate-binding protein [Acuticoccus kandeliae]
MRPWSRNSLLSAMSATALLVALPASAEELTIGMSADVTSMDPHFYNATPNKEISFHVFDTLTFLGADGSVEPWLATSWTPVGDNEWTVKLREGVTFHDGSTFGAEDVVYSLNRLDNVPGAVGGFSSLISAVSEVTAVDDTTVKITTSAPSPNLPISFTAIAMVPSENEGKGPDRYNAGEAMIGTGPYKFVSFTPGESIKLTANTDWWGGEVPWSEVEFRILSNVAARTTSLLSGDVDVVEMPAATDLERLKNDPKVNVVTAPALRLAFINPIQAIDPAGIQVTGPDGAPIEPTPLTDIRVRQAMSLAINREGLADRIMQGTGSVTGQMMPEGIYSFVPGYKIPEYDPEKARALMAEAGFGDGFSLTLMAANDRVPYNVEVAQAIAQLWSRIGIKTTVNGVPTSVYSREAGGQLIPVYLGSWGNSSMEVGTSLTGLLRTSDPEHSLGTYNWGKYSNPAFDAKLDEAIATMDGAAREKLLQEATVMALDDYAILPLYHLTNLWAMRSDLTYPPRPDAMTFAWLVKPAAK